MLQFFISLPNFQLLLPTNLIQSLRLVYTLLTEELLQDCNSYANRGGNKQSNHYNTTLANCSISKKLFYLLSNITRVVDSSEIIECFMFAGRYAQESTCTYHNRFIKATSGGELTLTYAKQVYKEEAPKIIDIMKKKIFRKNKNANL